jgi:hypothetical protein
MPNVGQTSVTPEKHGHCWTVRVWKDGKHIREKVCLVTYLAGWVKGRESAEKKGGK